MSDLDTLMTRISEITHLTPTELVPSNIDDIIAHIRTLRARKAAGEKSATRSTVSAVDINKILNEIVPPKKPTSINWDFLKKGK